MSGFNHKPVMLAEVLEALQPNAGGTFADGTVGGGGHAAAVLKASSPQGRLIGCDRDGAAIEAAGLRLAEFDGRFELHRGRFDELPQWVGVGNCSGVLLDLGVSSTQLDLAARGFSFQADGPLDMRMDLRQELTAATLVNGLGAGELARIFFELGEERESRKIARSIVEKRAFGRFETTCQLAKLIETVSPRRGQKVHPATRVFQALRIAVNDELGVLKRGLPEIWKLVRLGGRLAIITFHSLEDRVVKEFGRERGRDYLVPGEVDVPALRQPRVPDLRCVSRKPIKPGEAEIAENPRARSAQLRVMEKI